MWPGCCSALTLLPIALVERGGGYAALVFRALVMVHALHAACRTMHTSGGGRNKKVQEEHRTQHTRTWDRGAGVVQGGLSQASYDQKRYCILMIQNTLDCLNNFT